MNAIVSLILIFTLATAGVANPVPPPARPPRMVWAFYYPWYGVKSWNNPSLTDYPSVRYSSDDPDVIAHQIDTAQAAGIDGFVSSWWGPDDYTDHNLQTLLTLAKPRHFGVGLYFETLTDGKPRDAGQIYTWLVYALQTYGADLAQVNGKPLVFLWASETVPLATWRDIFARLRARGLDATFIAMTYNVASLDVFDGMHQYGIFNVPDLAGVEVRTARDIRAYEARTHTRKLWIATVQPGYDDRAIPGRQGLHQARENGEYYRATFEAALNSDPDWVIVTTWNEWYENTAIESGSQFGNVYLDITRDYARAWRAR